MIWTWNSRPGGKLVSCHGNCFGQFYLVTIKKKKRKKDCSLFPLKKKQCALLCILHPVKCFLSDQPLSTIQHLFSAFTNLLLGPIVFLKERKTQNDEILLKLPSNTTGMTRKPQKPPCNLFFLMAMTCSHVDSGGTWNHTLLIAFYTASMPWSWFYHKLTCENRCSRHEHSL